MDAILDARTTESMMFDMICKISHHVILVVNDNTWLEQEYAAMLLRVFGEGLIVVHNMRMTSCVCPRGPRAVRPPDHPML